MKQSQARFAVLVLNMSTTAVARYESSNPSPRGEVLLRLARIARENNRPDLADIFEKSYVDHFPKPRGSQLTADYLGAHVRDPEAHSFAQMFMLWLPLLDDPKTRKHAIAVGKRFKDAVRELDWGVLRDRPVNPAIADLQAIAALVNKGGKK